MPPRDAVDGYIAQWRRERPDVDPSPIGVIGRISRLAILLEQGLDRVYSRYGLGGGDFDVLATLRRQGSPFRLTPGELTRSTMITTGGMTKRLDRLEAAGLIRREPDPSDGRGKLIALTSQGRELVDRVVGAHLANEDSLLRGLSAAKRKELASLLRELILSLEQDEATLR